MVNIKNLTTKPIAHSENENGQVHFLLDHLRDTALVAREFGSKWNAGEALHTLGLIHDIGKFQQGFQEYLLNNGPQCPHAIVGTLLAFQLQSLFAFAVAGHHGGLANQEDLKEIIERHQHNKEYQKIIETAKELLPTTALTLPIPNLKPYISYELFLRMCFSALVDADYLDTERHFDSNKAEYRNINGYDLSKLWEQFHHNQEALIRSAKNTPLNQIRKQIYRDVMSKADSDQNFFSLTVPTGGGKTRVSLGFALKHALKNKLERIIVVIPYTNIIEQTADVYRDILGTDVVLEHHSAVDPKEESEMNRLASENWDKPIVVTTSVQFLESLFANKPSKCRKLHNIANSIVIFDEAQTVPPNLLSPILSVLDDLKNHYGVSIIFSTATQPAFKKRQGFEGLKNIFELTPNPDKLFDNLKRVKYNLDFVEEYLSWKDIADKMLKEKQALTIVNTKDDARELFILLKDRLQESVFHLSTNMCAVHRKAVLEKVNGLLVEGKPCYLVSTQLIEAGVNIDFPLVLRALAPLDSIVQAAGRCNREGKLDEGEVIVFRPEDEKFPPGVYRTATDNAKIFLDDPDLLHDPGIYNAYFKSLYGDVNLDKSNIQRLRQNMSFEEVSKKFKIIRDDSIGVIIENYLDKESPNLIGIRQKGFITREDWRSLQRYIVMVKKSKEIELKKIGLLTEVIDDVYVWAGSYDSDYGIKMEGFSTDDFLL